MASSLAPEHLKVRGREFVEMPATVEEAITNSTTSSSKRYIALSFA
jgi:hypothetical protein